MHRHMPQSDALRRTQTHSGAMHRHMPCQRATPRRLMPVLLARRRATYLAPLFAVYRVICPRLPSPPSLLTNPRPSPLHPLQRDIQEHGKLNFHLYLALKRALYKPSAFFKGLLLPLCETQCTLREALIISSVLTKVSVPMLHSAVAILKLAQMDFTPANALFLRTMLLKKYALPYRVVDALVDYFETFLDAPDIPPVVWQQTLLAFAQHYKVPTPRPARPDPHPEPLPCHTASPLMSLQICQSTEPPCGCNANVWTSEAVTPACLPACLAGCLSCYLPTCLPCYLRISPNLPEDLRRSPKMRCHPSLLAPRMRTGLTAVLLVTPLPLCAAPQDELTADQKDRLAAVLRTQPHALITPEIRRELFSGRVRGEAYIPSIAGADPMATG